MAQYQKLFVTGCPKSGTTWLMKCLNGHPQIVVGGEGRFAWRLFPFLHQAASAFNNDQQANGGSPEALIRDPELHLVMRSFSANTFLRYLLASNKPAGTVRIIGDKTPQHVLSVPLLRTLYPTCKFINIVRDPRDAAASALFHLNKDHPEPKELYIEKFITQTWKIHVESAIAAERQLGTNVFLNIRYRDLHQNESDVLRRCLEHLQVDASGEMIRLCSQAGSFDKLSGGRKRGQVDSSSFYRSGTIGGWTNHIDSALADRCCRSVAGLMNHFGYSVGPSTLLAGIAA